MVVVRTRWWSYLCCAGHIFIHLFWLSYFLFDFSSIDLEYFIYNSDIISYTRGRVCMEVCVCVCVSHKYIYISYPSPANHSTLYNVSLFRERWKYIDRQTGRERGREIKEGRRKEWESREYKMNWLCICRIINTFALVQNYHNISIYIYLCKCCYQTLDVLKVNFLVIQHRRKCFQTTIYYRAINLVWRFAYYIAFLSCTFSNLHFTKLFIVVPQPTFFFKWSGSMKSRNV